MVLFPRHRPPQPSGVRLLSHVSSRANLLIHDGGHDFRLRSQLISDEGLTLKGPDRASVFQHIELETKLIPGDNRPPELYAVHGHEVDALALRLLSHGPIRQHASGLPHGLYNEDARHDRLGGEMPLEKGFVDRHIFYPDNPLALFQFYDAIDKQKGISMG